MRRTIIVNFEPNKYELVENVQTSEKEILNSQVGHEKSWFA